MEEEENGFTIDFSGVRTEEDVQDLLLDVLPLPDYYGRNLDALYDALTEYGEGWRIELTHEEEADPDVAGYVEKTIETIEDASEEVPDLTVERD